MRPCMTDTGCFEAEPRHDNSELNSRKSEREDSVSEKRPAHSQCWQTVLSSLVCSPVTDESKSAKPRRSPEKFSDANLTDHWPLPARPCFFRFGVRPVPRSPSHAPRSHLLTSPPPHPLMSHGQGQHQGQQPGKGSCRPCLPQSPTGCPTRSTAYCGRVPQTTCQLSILDLPSRIIRPAELSASPLSADFAPVLLLPPPLLVGLEHIIPFATSTDSSEKAQ